MRAPSFRVTERTDGALVLHYASERSGLEHVVIGMVRTVAKKLHNKNVKVVIRCRYNTGKSVFFRDHNKTSHNLDLQAMSYRRDR